MSDPGGAFSRVLVVAEQSAFPFAEGLEQQLLRRIASQPRFALTADVRVTTLRAPALPAETRESVEPVVWALQQEHGTRGGRWETEFYPTPVGVTFMVVYLE